VEPNRAGLKALVAARLPHAEGCSVQHGRVQSMMEMNRDEKKRGCGQRKVGWE